MEEAVFIAQYTFLATPAVIEEESRILGKIARRLRCEYVIRFEDDGKFYFLLETRSGYEEHFARCGWYIVSQTDFNSRLTIGMGLYESGNLAGFMYRLDSGSEDEARFWNNILVFTFFNDFRKAFFPLDNRFQGFFRLDGSLCLYLYDYCPVRRNDKITFEGKKVSNAVWRFKSGEQTDLFVKLFSIAASRIRAVQENRHRAVLVPVPASTREKHRTRYEAFCRKLSADMGVADGYGAITVAYDRAQYKGTHGNGDRTANLEFHPERFRGEVRLACGRRAYYRGYFHSVAAQADQVRGKVRHRHVPCQDHCLRGRAEGIRRESSHAFIISGYREWSNSMYQSPLTGLYSVVSLYVLR